MFAAFHNQSPLITMIPYINESLQKRDTVLLCVSCTVFELGWWCLLVQLHTFLGVLTHSSLALPCPPSLPQKNTITSVHSLLQPSYPGTDLHIWHVHKSIWEKSSLYSSKLLHAVKSVAHPIWIYQCMYFFSCRLLCGDQLIKKLFPDVVTESPTEEHIEEMK